MNNCFQISHKKDNYTQPIYFHSHDFYEIYFFMDGNVRYYIENESYVLTKGDVLVIPPGKLHRPVIEENTMYERYVLWIYNHYAYSSGGISAMLSDINRITQEKKTRILSFDSKRLNTITDLLNGLEDDFASGNEISRYTAESRIIIILKEIADSFANSFTSCGEGDDVVSCVISHINRNVPNAPSLADLSERFFVSKYYLSRKFKERTKTTVHQYILAKKINLAKEMLEKGYSPKEVCDSCGFSTYSNFYKAFTHIAGISPKNFGREYLKTSE